MVPLLHIGTDHSFIPQPFESHVTFGSGFVLIAGLIVAEGLSGSVWHRSRFRSMIFPTTLIGLGFGMIVVTAVEPYARFVHFAMGFPMLSGGWAEARYRRGEVSRRFADAFIVPSLVFAGLDTALFHLNGPVMSGGFVSHGAIALTAVVLAALRFYQSQDVASLNRTMLMAGGVLALSVELYADSVFV